MAEETIKISDEEVLDALRYDIDKAIMVQHDLAYQREEYYKRYRCEDYGNEKDGWSKSIAPIIYNNLQWSLPNLMEIFHTEYFTLQGDDENRANALQKLIYYQMYRKQDGFKKAYDFLFYAYLYHYAIFKCVYKEEFDIIYEKYDNLTPEDMLTLAQSENLLISKFSEQEDENGGLVYNNVKVAKTQITYAGPHFEVIPPWEFFYSPDCKIGDWGAIEGRLVFHKVILTLNDIRKRERGRQYRKGSYEKVLASFEDPERAVKKPDAYEYFLGADEVTDQDSQAPESNELAKKVEVRECYYQLDIDGDGLLEPVIVTLCGNVVLQIVENPYKRPPFRVGSISPEPHKVAGLAMPKVLDTDQRVMTNLLRLIQDSAAQSCYRNPVTNDQNMFKMLQNRKPFAVILGTPEKLGEVRQAPPDPFILRAYEMLKQENEEKTGNTRYNQGTDAASLNKTATGISAIFNASEKRMRLIAQLIGNGPFSGIIRDFIFINQRWPSPDPIRLLGTNIEIKPEDMSGEYEIKINIGTSPSEKQSVANQLDLLVQFGTQAGLQLGIMRPEHILRAQRKKYRVMGINVNDCLVDEKEFLQAQERQRMASQNARPPQPQPLATPPRLQEEKGMV